MFSSIRLFEDRKWLISCNVILFQNNKASWPVRNDYNSVINTISIKSNNESQALWKWNENGLNNQTVSQTL